MQNLETLKQTFSGEIITPKDSGYEQVKNSFMYQGSPVVVFKPKNAQDVAVAIKYSQENKLMLSIRSGGHSGAPFSTNTDGVVIDLSLINSVEIIDPQKNIVKIGAGSRWGDVAKVLQAHGLAFSSGDTKTVGVGGLTTGAGIGWMVRKYGLAIDNVIGAELVTADGKIFNLSETENPDLFWAIRGGGSNFGVVTYFECIARPVRDVFAGPIMYGVENVGAILKGWRDTMRTADENLTTIVNILPAFPGSSPMVIISCCYAGEDEAKAMAAIDPLKKLGTPTNIAVKKKPYAEVLEDAHPPQGMKIVVRNIFIEDFSDDVIAAILAAQKAVPNFILQLRSLGGAMKRVTPDTTAFAYRNSEVLLVCPIFMPQTASDADIEKALEPWRKIAALGKGAYCNFLSSTSPEDVATIYPQETLEKLKKIKKNFDPENIFNQNHNIKAL